MSDKTGTVVDFSDDPHDSVFGLNQDGGVFNDPGGNALAALRGNTPGWSHYDNVKKSITEAVNPPQSYFHGEWWQELFIAIQAANDIGVQIIDAFDIGKSAVNFFTGNMLDAAGNLAGMLVKAGLDWIWSSVQPVQDAAGVLLGNPDKIKNSSEMWTAVAENLKSLEDALGPDLGTMLEECWKSEAGACAAVRAGDLVETVAFASQSSTGLSELLMIYSDMAAKINDLVRQILSDVVAALISAIGDIATKGPIAIIPVGIDLALMLASYTMRLINIAIQEI